MSDPLEAYIRSSRPLFEGTLRDWVAMPTVSAFPDHKPDILAGADAVAGFFRDLGAQAEVTATPGNPVVTAQFGGAPSQPTVLVYNHMDVQPAGEPEWKSEPFEMVVEGDVYRGRGTTDDKGPALTALLAARYAVESGIPLNIRFVWEFEEEIGSPNFEGFVRSNTQRLEADSIVVSDTIWLARDRPAMPFGLRGLLSVRMMLETGVRDVHSGLTGGAARNPISELCSVLADCWDPQTGRILIPGFHDHVRTPPAEELEGFRDSGFRVDSFRAAHELKRLRPGDAQDTMRRIWTEPTFEVHGIVGGYTGPGVKTAIPPRAEAKVSMRLVPDQSPRAVFSLLRDFVRSRNPDVEVILDSTLAPFIGPRTGPHAQAASDAVEEGFGRRPAWVREGGSIGAILTLDESLHVPILFMGLSLPEHGYHAPNENFDWGQASGGMRMFVGYFRRISGL